jgi:hypothetical protein
MLKNWFQIIRTIVVAAGVFLCLFAFIEIIRAYQTLYALHPAIGYLFLTAILAALGWLAWYLGQSGRRPAHTPPPCHCRPRTGHRPPAQKIPPLPPPVPRAADHQHRRLRRKTPAHPDGPRHKSTEHWPRTPPPPPCGQPSKSSKPAPSCPPWPTSTHWPPARSATPCATS